MPYSVVAENLKVLDETTLQEVNYFILFLIQKNTSNNKKDFSDVSSLRGSLAFAANSSLVENEKSAWSKAIKEKYEV